MDRARQAFAGEGGMVTPLLATGVAGNGVGKDGSLKGRRKLSDTKANFSL